MMTRKDYVAVAQILSKYQGVIDSDDYYEIVMDFGKMMKVDNTRFDLSRFMLACNIDINNLVKKALSEVS